MHKNKHIFNNKKSSHVNNQAELTWLNLTFLYHLTLT